jgi:nitrite reductase/ring-hydroxylating ferredoxin subunit
MIYKYKFNILDLKLNQPIFIGDDLDPILVTLSKNGENYSVEIFSANCPHMGGPLNKGVINGRQVTCPWHGCKFDMISGKGLSRLCLVQLDSLIEDGYLYVF